LFLLVQQLEFGELHSNLFCTYASRLNQISSYCNTSTGVQKPIFIGMTTVKHQLIKFINTYGMLRSLYENTSLLPAFLVRSLLLKKSLVQLLQKYKLHT